jgi:type I restriction enzyme S subunit
MVSNWPVYLLKDILEHVADNRGKNPKAYSESGIPVIDNYLITSNWRVDLGECRRCIDTETYQSFIRKHIKEDDVLITLVGNGYGQVAITPNEKCAIIQNTVGLRCNSENNNRYLYYLLKGNREILMNLNIGAAQPSIKVGNLMELPFNIPPLPEQKTIAHILGSLDDKIELNRKLNATLEGMAQALFKSWFVDFDPVIDNALAAGNPIPDELAARAEVRSQALANGTANREAAKAFPSAFQETESMGWIPEGWEVSTIGGECDTVGGGTPSTKNPDFWEGGEYPWVTPKDFSALQDKVLLSSSRFLTEVGLGKVSSGLLPIGTVLMSSRAPVGYLAIAQIETAINQGFIAMICNKRLPSEYILQWANSRMDDIKRASSGSTFAEISKKAFRPFQVIVPDHEPLGAYTKTVATIYSRITDSVSSGKTLTKLRDTLLPKLISGELRIPEAKQLIEKTLDV